MFLWNIAVTSLVEVWIEIDLEEEIRKNKSVTSLVEVWIEIWEIEVKIWNCICHFPCGSVD